MRSLSILLFYVLCACQTIGQDIHDMMDLVAVSPSAQVSLLTCKPGDEVYTMYGHSAIRVWDDSIGFDGVFNYGTYNFNTPGFLPKFIRGQLPYSLSTSSMRGFIASYRRQQRGVVQNVIRLDSAARYSLVQALNRNYLPENREYLYDFFYDNCSTRIWDVLEENVSEPIRFDGSVEPLTFRDMISLYQRDVPWTDFGIDLIIGSPADRIADAEGQMFLPDYLQQHLHNARVGNEPLLGEDVQLLQTTPVTEPTSWIRPQLVLLLLLFIEITRWIFSHWNSLWKVYDTTWWIVLGLAGVLLLFMWVGTDHLATHRNYNLLWLSPLYLLLLWRRMRRSRIVLAGLLVLLAVALLGPLGFLPQVMPASFSSMMLISVSKLAVLWRTRKVAIA